MTNAEMIVAIRVVAENAEETLESIKRAAEDMGASVEKAGREAEGAFKPLKDGAMEAAAAQATLAAAASAAFQVVIGAVKSGTDAYNAYNSAIAGLGSVAQGRGIADNEMTKALDGVTDAFFSATSAATAYKNLLSRGYTLSQATKTIERLKDAATFGRQANLSLEEAVVSATEGIRNENSILVDNAGVTKNVAKMWEDYARAKGVAVTSLTQAQKVEAEYLGIMEETKFQIGDLEKASSSLVGSQAEQAAQSAKLATAYGDAMAPAVQAMTEAGTAFLKTATDIVSQFPSLASGATTATTAFLALVAAMKGLEAAKGLLAALSIGSATLGPLAAVAAIVGIATTAYSAYTKAQEEAVKAEEEAAEEKKQLRSQELGRLKAVNDELSELKKQYGNSETSLDDLAQAYDRGNDAIMDRIRLLEEEQKALLEKQLVEAEARQSELGEERKSMQDALFGVFMSGGPKLDQLGDDPFSSGYYTDAVNQYFDTIEERFPQVKSLLDEYRAGMNLATNMEEATAAKIEFFDSLEERLESTQEEWESNKELIEEINAALEDPEAFSFDKVFDDTEDGAKGAAGGVDDLNDALKKAQKEYDDLEKDVKAVNKQLDDKRALKTQVSGYKDIVKEAKKAGKSWDDLSDDVKKFGKQLGVADGDIDGLITALDTMEGTLDASMQEGITQASYLIARLQALRATILAIPEAELTGDATDLLNEINIAEEELLALLELMAKAGISTKGGGGGGGGGGGKKDKSSGGGGKSLEQQQKEAYDEQIELLEHKRHLEQITAKEELEALERIKREYAKNAELIMDIDERIFDARKAMREEEAEKITSLYDAITEALEERYEEQREIEQKRIEESIEAWEKWSDETTAAIQAQIDALEEKEEAEERAAEEAEKLRKIEKLEASLPYERDEYNRQQILKQIEKAREELQEMYDEWAHEDQIKALEQEMEAIEKKAEEEIEKLEQESERIDSVYDKLTEGASLAAEAQKMLMADNQEEILELISNYAQDYEATGRSLGEKLFEGFQAAFGDITDYFAKIDAQFEDMVEKIQQNAFAGTQEIQSSGQGAANISSPTINQTVNFNQPVESAVNVAERMQEVSEELAAMM